MRERTQATQITYTSWEPRVVDTQAPTSVRMTVVVQGAPTKLEVVRPDGSILPLSAQDSTTYVTTFSAEQLLAGYKTGDAHNFVGYLDVYDGSTRTFRGNLFVNVRDQTMPNAVITQKAADVQSSAHIVNIRQDAIGQGALVPVDAIKTFYRWFADDFDFVVVVHPVRYFENRTYLGVRNDTRGIGVALFDQSATYGSAGRLQGIINYPLDGFFDLAEKGAIHEIGHRWVNYLHVPALIPGHGHWPISDLAFGVMGFTLPGGAGGDFPFELTAQAGGDYLLKQVTPSPSYNDLELYLMGLIPPESVGSHFVFDNQNQLDQMRDGGVLRGPVSTVTVANVIASDGARSPATADAQKSFRAGTIVLSAGRLLNASEMAFFEHMAARGESTSPLTYTSGFASGTALPFYLATGKRATLTTRVAGAASADLTVSTSGSGTGSVTSSPAGIDCGPACVAPFDVGSKVTLTAAPASGSTFVGWGGDCSGASVTCALTLDAAKSVQAMFAKGTPVPPAPKTARVTVSVAGKGRVVSSPGGIACPTRCTASYPVGSHVVLRATAPKGWRLVRWQGACTGAARCAVDVAASTVVRATFRRR